MTTPDTITLGSRAFVRSKGSPVLWRCGDWCLFRVDGAWQVSYLDQSSNWCVAPEEAYSDLLDYMLDEHESRARALREELGRV